MKQPAVAHSYGFPNGDCRAARISTTRKLALCLTKNSFGCPHILLHESKHLCSYGDCESIVKWTEAYEA